MNKKILTSIFVVIALLLSTVFYFQQRQATKLITERFLTVYQEQFDQKCKSVTSGIYNDLLSFNVIAASIKLKQLVGLGQFSGFMIVRDGQTVEEYNYQLSDDALHSIQKIHFSENDPWGEIHFVTSNALLAEIAKDSVGSSRPFFIFFAVMMILGSSLLLILYRSAKYLDFQLQSYFTPKFSPQKGAFFKFWNKLLTNLSKRNESYLEQRAQIERIKKDELFHEIATQVAHDIRSPVATLESLLTRESLAQNSNKALIMMALERIQSIADDLLERERKDLPTLYRIDKVIEEVIAQKRVQHHRDTKSFELDFHNSIGEQALDLKIERSDLARILSNLINNSIEASKDEGARIVVETIYGEKQELLVKIKDNGKGIPAQVLEKIGERGVSFGKVKGNGLGIYNARQKLVQVGARLIIESSESIGTTTTLIFPGPMLPQECCVLLDDDPLVQLTWQAQAQAVGIELRVFDNGDDLFSALEGFSKGTIFYLDCYLHGEMQGPKIARELYSRGFREIYFATGEAGLNINEFPEVRGLVGKNCPF